MTEAGPPANTPNDALMACLIDMVAPLLMANGATSLDLARLGARQAIDACAGDGKGQLTTIVQTVGFALASLDTLRISADPAMAVSTKLKLRGTANALHRSTHRSLSELQDQRQNQDNAPPADFDPDEGLAEAIASLGKAQAMFRPTTAPTTGKPPTPSEAEPPLAPETTPTPEISPVRETSPTAKTPSTGANFVENATAPANASRPNEQAHKEAAAQPPRSLPSFPAKPAPSQPNPNRNATAPNIGERHEQTPVHPSQPLRTRLMAQNFPTAETWRTARTPFAGADILRNPSSRAIPRRPGNQAHKGAPAQPLTTLPSPRSQSMLGQIDLTYGAKKTGNGESRKPTPVPMPPAQKTPAIAETSLPAKTSFPPATTTGPETPTIAETPPRTETSRSPASTARPETPVIAETSLPAKTSLPPATTADPETPSPMKPPFPPATTAETPPTTKTSFPPATTSRETPSPTTPAIPGTTPARPPSQATSATTAGKTSFPASPLVAAKPAERRPHPIQRPTQTPAKQPRPQGPKRNEAWARAMTDVATDYSSNLHNLPPSQRRAQIIRIGALSATAQQLAQGNPAPATAPPGTPESGTPKFWSYPRQK